MNLETLSPGNASHSIGVAHAHPRIRLLMHCFHHWSHRLSHQCLSIITRYLVDKFLSDVLDERIRALCFRTWLQELRCVHHAEQFRRKNVNLVFGSWVTLCRSHAYHRRIQLVAVLYNIRTTRLRWLTRWHVELSSHLNNIAKVQPFIRKRLLHHPFSAWCAWYIRLLEVPKISQKIEILRQWHVWACSHEAERRRTGFCLRIANELLYAAALRRTLKQWRTNLKLQRMATIAESFNSHMILQRVIYVWQELPTLRKRKRRLMGQADEFRTRTLKIQYFGVWCFEHRWTSRYQRLDALALCRWSLRLQACVWSAWRQWVLDCGELRRRAEEALAHYQRRTASDALREWIHAAMEARHFRQQALYRSHRGCDVRTFRISANVAMRWYWLVLSKQNNLRTPSVGLSRSNPQLLIPSASYTTTQFQQPTPFVLGPSGRLVIEDSSNRLTSLRQPICPRFFLPYLHEKGISITGQQLFGLPFNFVDLSSISSSSSAETISHLTVLNDTIRSLQVRMDYLRILKVTFRLERFLTISNHFPSRPTEQCSNLRKQLEQEKILCKKQLLHIISHIQKTFFANPSPGD